MERARKAANARWARPTASREQSEKLQDAVWIRYENRVDPRGELSGWQRRKLAERAMKAHLAGMRLTRANKAARGDPLGDPR